MYRCYLRFEEMYQHAKTQQNNKGTTTKDYMDEGVNNEHTMKMRGILDTFLPLIKSDIKVDPTIVDFSFECIKSKYLNTIHLNISQNQSSSVMIQE